MKFDIVAVFFTILAVPHCESALDGKGLESKSQPIDIRPAISLAFITDKIQLRMGAAVVTPSCAITLRAPLDKYADKTIESGKLYIGIGAEIANIQDEKFLHSVKSVTSNQGTSTAAHSSHLVAIVTFELDITRVPKNFQFIPVLRCVYSDHNCPGPLNQLIVMWNMWGARKINDFREAHNYDYKSTKIVVMMSGGSVKTVNSACLGGFVTQDKKLAGVLYEYPNPNLSDRQPFTFVRVYITEDFLKKVPSEKKLNVNDFYKTYIRQYDKGNFEGWV